MLPSFLGRERGKKWRKNEVAVRRSDQEQVVNKVVFAAERENKYEKKILFPTCFLLAGEKERRRSKSAAEIFLETKSEIWHNNTRPNHFLEEKNVHARTHARTHGNTL